MSFNNMFDRAKRGLCSNLTRPFDTSFDCQSGLNAVSTVVINIFSYDLLEIFFVHRQSDLCISFTIWN